ncbi:MAG: lysine--tRNA ligase [Pseudonocardiaceae bacterium]
MSWMDRLADEVEQQAPAAMGRKVVCVSGISPSGPIHMGNLREVFTTHLVAEALRRRGNAVVHLHSWDDYDRLRKVPAGVDSAFEEYVGSPLSAVPDPWGERQSFAEHFIAEFASALSMLGIEMRQVRQSDLYPSGVYNAAIRRAMDYRETVFDILSAQQTPGRHDKPIEQRRAAYFPFRPYCETCGRDTTVVVSYAAEMVCYSCRCGHVGTMSLADAAPISGKLVWKVDWPMRWAHEGVAFEPAGEDHHAPTGSFTVGRELVKSLYDASAPSSVVYSFVGMAGASGKMSGSVGGAAIPSTALDVLEPAIVRWLYARRNPSQSFSIDLGPQAVQRLYDEWDQFLSATDGAEADPVDADIRSLCLSTSVGDVVTSPRPVSFRLLASAADITQANTDQIARIVADHLDDHHGVPAANQLLRELEPRLGCAINWATRLLAPEERTRIVSEFSSDMWRALDEVTQHGIHLLAARLADAWTLDRLTGLVYGVPKVLLGLPWDAAPSPELKKAQRTFFKAVYRLLCGSETGPRLPTLLLSIGLDRSRDLLIGNTTDPLIEDV